jgi:hypothetical protein
VLLALDDVQAYAGPRRLKRALGATDLLCLGATMAGTIHFQYDEQNQIVIATPRWKIDTEADVIAWYGQYERYMRRFPHKMDFIVVLDEFDVSPLIGSKWGEYRAKLHKQFTRFNFRVHSKRDVKLFVNTSGVRYNVSTEEAASVADAIQAILKLREQELTRR